MKYTKKELESAFYLLLDEVLPLMECEKIKREGSYNCDRCDVCMKEQYIKRIKNGEVPKIERKFDVNKYVQLIKEAKSEEVNDFEEK